jgi:hypothetical protein
MDLKLYRLHTPRKKRYVRRSKPVVLSDLNSKSLPSVPKTKTTSDSLFQSDSGNSFSFGRDRRDLLRSTGHLFRDGRWLGTDDPFHSFRDLENPGLGQRFSFQGGDYFRSFVVNANRSPSTFNWVPTVARSYVADDAFSTYKVELPDVVVPATGDFTFTLNGLGTSFIRRFRPGNPVANLGEFIIELRDLPQLPRFLSQRAKHFRDLGSEYLNVEFGWKPFIADLRKVTELQRTLKDRLNKLIQGNGIRVKRRSKHETRSVSSVADIDGRLNRPFGELADPAIGGDSGLSGYLVMGPVPFGYFDPFMQGDCIYHAKVEHTTESWFVGTYHYYVQDIGSDRWTERAIAELYGLAPHPEVIYRTYPWTWLADWFFNVGDIVSNLSSNAVDSEALGGGFVMMKDLYSFTIDAYPTWDTFSWDPFGTNEFCVIPAGEAHCHYSHIVLNKHRRQASPFGFGLRPNDLTVRQDAILLALATSRRVQSGRFLSRIPGRDTSIPY